MYDVRTVAKTKGNKDIVLTYDERTNLYGIKFSPGGQLPKQLEGNWTSTSMAQQAITAYLGQKNKSPEETNTRQK